MPLSYQTHNYNKYFDLPRGDKTNVGIAGFDLEVRIKEGVSQFSDIPDVPIETGAMVGDHIINRPITLTISGDIGGIHVRKSNISTTVNNLSSMVDTATNFLPSSTAFQLQQLKNNLVVIDDIAQGYINKINRGLSLFGIGNNDTSNLQQAFFDHITAIRESKQIIDVKMPFKTYHNMVVVSFVSYADNEATSLGFELGLKELIITDVGFAPNVFDIENPDTQNKVANKISSGEKPTTEVDPADLPQSSLPVGVPDV